MLDLRILFDIDGCCHGGKNIDKKNKKKIMNSPSVDGFNFNFV